MRIIIVLSLFLCCINTVFAGEYGLYTPENYNFNPQNSEKILFIMDFSNSMNERLHGTKKVDMMVNTMARILADINPNTMVGLRIYGHRLGFTQADSCRASSLVVPVSVGKTARMTNILQNTSPKGMTPITYSLKQAVIKDFLGFNGKKHIILLTDGGENCDESPCKYAMELIKTRKDIFIDVIAFNIDNEEDLEQLRCAALVTSGKFYSANTAAELVNSLNNSVNAKKQVEAKIITNY